MPPQHSTASEALKTSLPQGHAGTVTCSYKALRREGAPSVISTFAAEASPALPSLVQGLYPRAGTWVRRGSGLELSKLLQ